MRIATALPSRQKSRHRWSPDIPGWEWLPKARRGRFFASLRETAPLQDDTWLFG